MSIDLRRIFEQRHIFDADDPSDTEVATWQLVLEAEMERHVRAFYDGPHFRVLKRSVEVQPHTWCLLRRDGTERKIVDQMLVIRWITIDDPLPVLPA